MPQVIKRNNPPQPPPARGLPAQQPPPEDPVVPNDFTSQYNLFTQALGELESAIMDCQAAAVEDGMFFVAAYMPESSEYYNETLRALSAARNNIINLRQQAENKYQEGQK